MKDINLKELLGLWLAKVMDAVFAWHLKRVERNCMMSAEVERQRAREAHMNAAYFEKRAALARSARSDVRVPI